MKNTKKFLLLLIAIISLENVYAATDFEFNTQNIISIICISLVLLGLALIIVGKMNERKGHSIELEKPSKKSEIVGLKDKDKEETEKDFSSDSIFKEIPTFSNKKFFDITNEEFKKKLFKEDDELIEINIKNEKIIDFEITEKKYIITTEYEIEVKKEIEKDIYKYIVKSEKQKEQNEDTNITLTNCPNCGGKIKDPTLKRCLHCGQNFEKEHTSKTWKITKIEKMD